MPDRDALIEFVDVYKEFAGRQVLRGLSLSARRGEVTTILGPSGCGKSVTLKHIIGIVKADRGRVMVAGHDMNSIARQDLSELRKRIGVLFQSSALFDSMTVKENVVFGLRMHTRTSEDAIAERARICLEQVDLPGAEDRMPAELSGGMRKRAALARAIALSPEMVLYDEPTTGLDPRTANVVGDLIVRLQRELAITSVVVTHDIPLTRRISDSVALIAGGKVVATGPMAQIESSPVFARFIDGEKYAEREQYADREEG